MKRTIFLAAVVMAAATASLANIANPDLPNSKKTIDTMLQIQLDREAKEARLIIPRSQVKQLRAELDALESGSDNAAAMVSGEDEMSGTQTVVSGLFISLAMVFGGLWFVKSKRMPRNSSGVTAAMATVFAIGGLAFMAHGNAGPPSEARSITGKMFSQAVHIYGFGSGKIKLEVSDTERNPKLIVPNPKAESSPGEK
jgi:hypothetical protein